MKPKTASAAIIGQENLSSFSMDQRGREQMLGRPQHQQMTVDEVWKMSFN
jgi:hypothetical protein